VVLTGVFGGEAVGYQKQSPKKRKTHAIYTIALPGGARAVFSLDLLDYDLFV
jgi:hypothetical protein